MSLMIGVKLFKMSFQKLGRNNNVSQGRSFQLAFCFSQSQSPLCVVAILTWVKKLVSIYSITRSERDTGYGMLKM